jgi:hypothetical protein
MMAHSERWLLTTLVICRRLRRDLESCRHNVLHSTVPMDIAKMRGEAKRGVASTSAGSVTCTESM